jgi:hypothetical protein
MRRLLLIVLGVLWGSGLLWLLLHFWLATPGEFGVTRHPLEGPLLMLHGLVAMLALFLLGGFTARHAQAARSGQRRASGGWLAVALVLLAVAGCLQLFVADQAAQAALSLVHEVLGVGLLLPLLAHGWRFSVARRGAGDRASPGAHGQPPRRGLRSARN